MELNITEKFMIRYRDSKVPITRTEISVRHVVRLSSTFRQDRKA